MFRNKLTTIIAILIVTLLLTGCAGLPVQPQTASDTGGAQAEQPVQESGSEEGSPSGDEIVIGVIAPLTGSKAEQGAQFKEGAEVAVADLNAAGGILGRPVSLEILDDQGQPNEAAAAAQKVVSNPSVIAVIGPSSTASSSAAAPILEKAKIVAISPSASTPTLVTDNECFYLMSLPTTSYGPLIPKVAVEQFSAEDLAIIFVKDDWGEGVTKLSNEWAEENDIPIVAEASYTQGDRDFKSQLTALFAEDPDALVLITHYTEGALITKQARDLGYEGPIVGQGTIVYPQYIELAGDTSEGIVSWVDFLASLDTEAVQNAVTKFQDATGKEPLQYHISSYDAVNIIAAAIEKVGNTEDRGAICSTVGETKDYEGIVGRFSYNEDRLPDKDIFLVTVKDNEWSLYQP